MAEDQTRQLRLLVWLADQGDGIYPLDEVYAGDEEAALARRDVNALGAPGLVRPSLGGGPSLGAVQASITPAGRARAGEVKARQQDRSGRQWACRSALVSWLFDVDAVESMTSSKIWEEFFLNDRSTYYGDKFTDEEVDRAAAWLYRNGLIDGVTVAEFDGPVRSYLTNKGVRCAERFDSDVRRYLDAMEQPRQPQGGPTFNVNATNVQVATGDQSQQTMTVSQTSDQLVLVIQGIVEMLQALGLTAGHEAELAEVQEAAVADVTSDVPDGEAVRRFCDWVIDCVKEGGTAAAVAAVTAASNGLLHDAEALVRAIAS